VISYTLTTTTSPIDVDETRRELAKLARRGAALTVALSTAEAEIDKRIARGEVGVPVSRAELRRRAKRR